MMGTRAAIPANISLKKAFLGKGPLTGAVDVYAGLLLLEQLLKDSQTAIVPYRRNVERNSMNQTEQQAYIGQPPMENIEPFVSDPGQHRDEVCFHAERYDPRHKRDRDHSRADGQRW